MTDVAEVQDAGSAAGQGDTGNQGAISGQGETGGVQDAGAGESGADSGSVTPTWRDSIADEYKENEAFKDVEDINALLKNHLDLKKSNEELAGKIPVVPETADGYALEIPPGVPEDKTFVGLMKDAAHKAGMGQEQFKVMADHYIAIQKAALDYIATEQEKGINALKVEWGTKYDANTTVAQQAFKKFAPTEDEANYLKTTGLDKDPVLIRIFHRVGSAVSEDYLPGGDGGIADSGVQRDQHGKPMLTFEKSLGKK